MGPYLQWYCVWNRRYHYCLQHLPRRLWPAAAATGVQRERFSRGAGGVRHAPAGPARTRGACEVSRAGSPLRDRERVPPRRSVGQSRRRVGSVVGSGGALFGPAPVTCAGASRRHRLSVGGRHCRRCSITQVAPCNAEDAASANCSDSGAR